MTATTEPQDLDLDVRPDAVTEPSPGAPGGWRRDRSLAVTHRRVIRSEWIKLWSVRSSAIGLVAAAAAAILLGVLISSATGSATAGPGGGGAPPGTGTDALSLSLSGFRIAQLVIGCLGVLVVTSDYATGMIRATFAAVTNRLTVLRAKVLVFGAVAIAVTSVAALISFAGGQAVYHGGGAVSSISDPGVLRVVLGTALYTTGFGLIGIALGFLLRSTAAAIGVLVAALMVVPVLIGLLPGSVTELWSKYLPTNAGSAFTTLRPGSQLLSPGAGAVVFSLWVIGLLVLAGAVLRRRDA